MNVKKAVVDRQRGFTNKQKLYVLLFKHIRYTTRSNKQPLLL